MLPGFSRFVSVICQPLRTEQLDRTRSNSNSEVGKIVIRNKQDYGVYTCNVTYLVSEKQVIIEKYKMTKVTIEPKVTIESLPLVETLSCKDRGQVNCIDNIDCFQKGNGGICCMNPFTKVRTCLCSREYK